MYCPARNEQVDGTTCLEICIVADREAKPTILPEGTSWNEEQRQKCLSCKWEAFKCYKRAFQTGELSALADFSLYQKSGREIDEKLVGLTTSNGITITVKLNHFVARVIDSVEQRRSGVGVGRVLKVFTSKDMEMLSKRVSPNGKASQRFILGDIKISINTENGNLIQVNPYSREKK